MNAGDILKNINGLTHDKLTYFVRCGYVNPVKIRRGSLDYNQFSDDDLELIRGAWHFIRKYDMKTKSAFERARKKREDQFQPNLFNLK